MAIPVFLRTHCYDPQIERFNFLPAKRVVFAHTLEDFSDDLFGVFLYLALVHRT
jgi:hypothetical protein